MERLCDESVILYNVYNHRHWSIETEDHSFRIPQSFNVSAWSILRTAGSLIKSNVNNVVFPLNQYFLQLKQRSLDWKISFNHTFNALAILTDQEILLTSFESGFNDIVSSYTIPRDNNTKWSIIKWSNSGNFLVYCSSKAQISIFDRKLSLLSSSSTDFDRVQETPSETFNLFETIDSGNCFCSVALNEDANQEVIYIYCLSYRGMMYGFIFETSWNDLQRLFTVNLSSTYFNGVYAMVFAGSHNIFITGSVFQDAECFDPHKQGVSSWRLLDEHPWLTDMSESHPMKISNRGSWKVGSVFSKTADENINGVFSLVLSRDESSVFALNWFGSVSQWSVPGLISIRSISFHDICQSPVAGADVSASLLRTNTSDAQQKFLWCMRLWDENEAVFSTFEGLLDIQKIDTGESCLGKCEKFTSAIELSDVFLTDKNHKAFVGLEMDKKVSRVKRQFKLSESSDNEDDDDESEDEEFESWRRRGSRYLKKGLYFITESDHFQPPKKKPKLITKTFRVFSFQSTTPEALFKIKLQNEEFGEALSLAKHFSLDSDLVFMRQWRKYPVSNATIHDYLRKISKRHWILRECATRVSRDLDATRSLLSYGLIGTEIEVLIQLGIQSDEELKLLEYDIREECEATEEDAYLSRQQIEEKRKAVRNQKVQVLLEQIEKVDSLTLEQKQILRVRQKLIHYLRTLTLYEEVLGGAEKAAQNFSSEEFCNIRDQSWLKTCVDFAQSSDWRAVDTMLMHVEELDESRLVILSNFPETLDVSEYADLLPVQSNDGKINSLFMASLFDSDWLESSAVSKLFSEELKLKTLDTKSLPEVIRPQALTCLNCSEWFLWRARQIESSTGLLSNACELLQRGVENQIPSLLQLLTDMQFLSSFVLDKQADVLLNFEYFSGLSEFEKLTLVLQSSTPGAIVKDFRKFIKPRLNLLSAKEHDDLFRQLLIVMSLKGLEKLERLYEACTPKVSEPLETNQLFLMQCAVDCIYNCPRTDQLQCAYAILNCLPLRASGKFGPQFDSVFESIDSLEIHMEAASILNKFEILKPVVFYKQVEHDKTESVKLLNELVVSVIKQNKKTSTEDWLNFLVHDLFQLQNKLMKTVPGQECFQVFVTQLLRADTSKLTKMALKFLTLSPAEKAKPFSYATIASFKLSFEESTDIVLNVAQEFVDSASSVNDSSISSAVSLLKTIQKPPSKVQDENDFIEMLMMLQHYNCSLLPVVIRNKYNYESLLKYILAGKEDAYVHWTKLLKIASLFKSSKHSNEEKKAFVRKMVAECALNNKYADLALEMCQQLMDLKCKEAWIYCWQLVQLENLKDLSVKWRLVAFTMCFCSNEVLPEVVRVYATLNIDPVQFSSTGNGSGDIHLFPVLGTLERTGKELLKETQQTTQKLLSSQGLHLQSVPELPFSEAGIAGSSFYDSQTPSSDCISLIDLDTPKIDEDYLRLISSLNGRLKTKNEETEGQVAEAMTSCSKLSFKEDIILSTSFILACNSKVALLKIVEGLKKSTKSFNFSLLALALLSKMNNESDPLCIMDCVRKTPESIIIAELNKVEPSELAESPLFVALQELHSFVEGSKLNALDKEVDISRFSVDEKYRVDTILALASNTDTKLLTLAAELANRHHVEVWDVHMQTLAHLLTNEASARDVRSHLKSMNLISKVAQKPEQLVLKLQNEVLKKLASDDLEKLALYFEILRDLNLGDLSSKATRHVEVLESVRKLAPLLPYKELLGEDSGLDINELVANFCTPKNYSELSTAISLVPETNQLISRSRIVFCYAKRCFYNSKGSTSLKDDEVNFLKSCIDQMSLEELKAFSELLAYQEDDINVVDLKSISVLIRKCLAASRKTKKKQLSGEVSQAIEATYQEMEKLLRADRLIDWLDSSDEIKKGAGKALWLSKNEKDTQFEVLIGLVYAHISFDEIDEIIKSLSIDATLTEVIEVVMTRCMEDIADCQHIDLVETSKPLIDVLTDVRKQVESKRISEDRVVMKLREITSIPNLSTDAKIFVLEKIEHLFNLNEQDLKSLLHSRTKTLLADLFSDSVFTEDDLSSEEGRYVLICDLLDCSVNSTQFSQLLKLINMWPKFHNYHGNQHPFVAVACKWIQSDPKNALNPLKSFVEKKLSDVAMRESLNSIVEFCFDSDLVECAVVFGLKVNSSQSHLSKIVDVLNGTEFELPESSFEDLVNSDILYRVLASKCYCLVLDHLIEQQNESLMQKVVHQLSSKGFQLEAADFLGRFTDHHSSFNTITGAVGNLRSWFKFQKPPAS